MDNTTCVEDGCTAAVFIKRRALCKRHYHMLNREGKISKPPGYSSTALDGVVHNVTNIDVDGRTAMCSVCGPTGVKISKRRRGICLGVVRQEKAEARKKAGKKPARTASPANLIRYANRYLSSTEREAVFASANGNCEICGQAKKLVVDHSHSTGKIRGALCHACNVALGWFRDSESSMLAAVSYLRERS